MVLFSELRMRYVASYLLAALGGNASPSAKDIKKILDSVGIEADDDRLNKVAAWVRQATRYTLHVVPPPTRRQFYVWESGLGVACASPRGYFLNRFFGARIEPQSNSQREATPRPAWFNRSTVEVSYFKICNFFPEKRRGEYLKTVFFFFSFLPDLLKMLF